MTKRRFTSTEPVQPADRAGLAAFIFQHNRTADGRVRCLHGHQGEDLRSHVAELAELPPDEAAFWRARDPAGATLGVIGCEIDKATRRAWIRGPWSVAGPSSPALESALLSTLEDGLPAIAQLDAFPSEDDAGLAAVYRVAGYRRMDVHRVMQTALGDRAASILAGDPRVAPALPADLPHWLPLHHDLFPASYLPDDEIARALGEAERLVLTARLDGRPAGYLLAKDDPTADEIYVDYLGVDPSARGHGLGRALLQHAMRWGSDRGRRQAVLTVRQDRAQALSLYRRSGFEQARAGVNWRKVRSNANAPPSGER